MNSRWQSLSMGLSLLLVLGMSPGLVSAGHSEPLENSIERFDWCAGDWWNYTYRYDYEDIHLTGKYTFQVAEKNSLTTIMKFEGNGNITWDPPLGRGTWVETGVKTYHTPSLAVVSNQARMHLEFTQPEYHQEESFIITNYTPPYDVYSFPVQENESWKSAFTASEYYYILLDGKYYDMEGNIVSGPQRRALYREYVHRYINTTHLTISGMTLTTSVISSENGTRVLYLSNEASNEVRVERYTENGTLISLMELTNWHKSSCLKSKVDIHVQNWMGKPLSDAIVTIVGTCQGRTDRNGVFQCVAPNGKYTVEVSRPGFETWRKNVTIEGDITLTITLDACGRVPSLYASLISILILLCIGFYAILLDPPQHKKPP